MNYSTLSYVRGFFIRKANWIDILKSNPEIVGILKKNILLEYLIKLKLKVELAKKRAIEVY